MTDVREAAFAGFSGLPFFVRIDGYCCTCRRGSRSLTERSSGLSRASLHAALLSSAQPNLTALHSCPKESIIIDNNQNGSRNRLSGTRGGAGSVGVDGPAPAWHLPRPRKSATSEFFRIFVKALHSLAVVVFGVAAVYLMYCGITGHRDAWMAAALIAVAVETVAYLSFGVKCPLTMLARWLGDDGGHDYLFEWLLGRERIWLVSRSLALLAAVGVALILVGSFTPLLPSSTS